MLSGLFHFTTSRRDRAKADTGFMDAEKRFRKAGVEPVRISSNSRIANSLMKLHGGLRCFCGQLTQLKPAGISSGNGFMGSFTNAVMTPFVGQE